MPGPRLVAALLILASLVAASCADGVDPEAAAVETDGDDERDGDDDDERDGEGAEATTSSVREQIAAIRGSTTGAGGGARERVAEAVDQLDPTTPSFSGDFADPFVVRDGAVFYAYATNTIFDNVPVLRAGAGTESEFVGDALPELPEWGEPGWVWAPSVAEIDGTWVLYYTTRHSASGRQCISVAVADSPEGPFVDESTEPLVCDLDGGGSIDPSPFQDTDGSWWLLWKSDGNCCGLPTWIYAQPLTDDGLELAGDPVPLLRDDLEWENDLIEGPTMTEEGGRYHLFYSANRWDTEDYVVGHAVCESVTGPCVKDPEPFLESHEGAWGPGGLEIVTAPAGRTGLVVYHGWTESGVGYETGRRSLFVTPVAFVRGDPVLPALELEGSS